jgi:hypothetical protein
MYAQNIRKPRANPSHRKRLAAPPANPSAPRKLEGGRRSPTEREWEQKCRDIANTPQKYALQIQELTKQLEAACLELEEIKKSNREEIDAWQKVIDGLRAEIQDKISTTAHVFY